MPKKTGVHTLDDVRKAKQSKIEAGYMLTGKAHIKNDQKIDDILTSPPMHKKTQHTTSMPPILQEILDKSFMKIGEKNTDKKSDIHGLSSNEITKVFNAQGHVLGGRKVDPTLSMRDRLRQIVEERLNTEQLENTDSSKPKPKN